MTFDCQNQTLSLEKTINNMATRYNVLKHSQNSERGESGGLLVPLTGLDFLVILLFVVGLSNQFTKKDTEIKGEHGPPSSSNTLYTLFYHSIHRQCSTGLPFKKKTFKKDKTVTAAPRFTRHFPNSAPQNENLIRF